MLAQAVVIKVDRAVVSSLPEVVRRIPSAVARCLRGTSRTGVLLWTATTAGCLDPAPSYEAQEQIPPFIVISQVAPPLNEMVEVLVSDPTLTVQVPFRSEDLGEPLEAIFLFNSRPGQNQAVVENASVEIPPSVFEDDTRAVIQPINLDLDPGCHTLTMVLAHASNLRGVDLRDEARAARATWWLYVRGTEGSSSLDECLPQGGR